MRTIQEIKADMLRLHNHLLDGGDGCIFDTCGLAKEAADALALTADIPTDELERMVLARGEGRLVVLPCKVGSTVYFLGWLKATEYFSANVCEDGLVPSNVDLSDDVYGIIEGEFEISDYDQIGETVFLTRELAENALGGGDDGRE